VAPLTDLNIDSFWKWWSIGIFYLRSLFFFS